MAPALKVENPPHVQHMMELAANLQINRVEVFKHDLEAEINAKTMTASEREVHASPVVIALCAEGDLSYIKPLASDMAAHMRSVSIDGRTICNATLVARRLAELGDGENSAILLGLIEHWP